MNVRRACVEYDRLSQEYNRVLAAWSEQSQKSEGGQLLEQLEEEHQKLVEHQQYCPSCLENLGLIKSLESGDRS